MTDDLDDADGVLDTYVDYLTGETHRLNDDEIYDYWATPPRPVKIATLRRQHLHLVVVNEDPIVAELIARARASIDRHLREIEGGERV